MSEHPYKNLPPHAFWRRGVAEVPSELVDPVVEAGFKLANDDKIATAGSCFAQHLSRYLSANGFRFYVTEDAHPVIAECGAEEYGYGIFTARYGNIYTARQLMQLFERAYQGIFLSWDQERLRRVASARGACSSAGQ